MACDCPYCGEEYDREQSAERLAGDYCDEHRWIGVRRNSTVLGLTDVEWCFSLILAGAVWCTGAGLLVPEMLLEIILYTIILICVPFAFVWTRWQDEWDS